MKKVIIAGAGISGLSSAIFLKEAGYDVEIYEKTFRTGGRIFSYYDSKSDCYIDNGKHILAGWYDCTIKLLKILKAEDNFIFPKALKIGYLYENGKIRTLDFSLFPKPLNFIFGIIRTDIFGLKDKILLLKAFKEISKCCNDDMSMSDFLRKTNQSRSLIKYFWQPFSEAAFNSICEKVAVSVFKHVMKCGLVGKSSSALIVPKYDLYTSLISPIENYYTRNNIEVKYKSKISEYKIENGKVRYAVINHTQAFGDYFIQAYSNSELNHSSIISVHFLLGNPISNKFGIKEFYFLPGSFLQWVFIDTPLHISCVISNCNEVRREEEYIEEISKFIKGLKIKKLKIISNKKATFIPDVKSQELIKSRQCKADNLFFAGDESLTGFPSTIEHAVRSGMICAEKIIVNDKNSNG
jgi:hypothetical protein